MPYGGITPKGVYYNEIEPYAVQWLRNLMAEGLIPAGDIDTRSIEDVRPSDLSGYVQCHFFAGIGGWPLALALAGWPSSRPVWTGSCPCQPFSAAGKGAGFEDERDLWPAWFHLISQCRPSVIFGEQVAAAIGHGWLDRAEGDLESQGYACGPFVLPASAVNAPFRGDRLWFVAEAERNEQSRKEPRRRPSGRMGRIEQSVPWNEPWQSALSRFRAMGDGLSRSVGATDAARNAIVPQVAAEFIQSYAEARGLMA